MTQGSREAKIKNLAFYERQLKEAKVSHPAGVDLADLTNTDILMDNLIVIEALVESRLGVKLGDLGSFMNIWSDTLVLDTGCAEIHITKMESTHMTTKEVMEIAANILGELEHRESVDGI